MPNADAPPNYDYVAYIDESGDPGITRVKPLDERGSSEWLIVAAVVVAASREAQLSAWNGTLMSTLNSRQMREVHFAKLNPTRKLQACEHVASLPVRCFAVASNKQNMRGWRNPFAEKIRSDNWFYCWMTRLLLERVTHWAEHRSLKDYGEIRKVKLVYSERGGLSYSQMNAYYSWLRSKGENQFLTAGNLVYETMDMRLLEVQNHTGHDGLKMPDIVASALFKAADRWDTGACDPRFAKALAPRMARWPEPNGAIAGYGVKLMPTLGKLINKTQSEQLEIFRHFGYPDQWRAGSP
ncbi:DUF3800 domain-containing protein [Caulobacter sp. S45]|uniref:DUF3800 domain-containing protein n=1 Tax=Caulobacter sp. S45 TaxID=1641861 RepID=UPI00131EAD4F|nr:DUF3800 domain-containing protein [Caulobacter sp. S45]